jgi:PAS domain S-box-containing protein
MPIDKSILEQLKLNQASLAELDLSYRELTIEDLRELITALTDNTNLSILNISGNHFGNAGFQLVISSLLTIERLIARDCDITSFEKYPSASKLLHLDLANNKFNLIGAELLATAPLQSLSLAGNHCNDDVAIVLAKSITLTKLILSHNKIKIKGCEALAQNTSIKELGLNYNNIQTEGANALALNQIIEILCVAGNAINEMGILSLACHNTTILTLDVSYNFVNDESFGALGKHPSLINLNVGYNLITYKGAQLFATNNKSLLSLIICHNLLGDSGAIAILKHSTIKRLDLSGNSIGFSGGRAAYKNEVVTSLILSTNMLGETGGIMLAQNTTLTELYLSYNGIGDDAAAIFADNHTLETLNLNYNTITEKGRGLLVSNKAIKSLIISEEQPPEFTSENLVTMFLLAESFQCISDLDGTLQFFNPAFSRVLGYSSDELLATSALDFLHPDDKTAELSRQKETALIHVYENRYRCSDGTYRTFQWRSQVKNNRLYADGHDMTEYRLIEQATILNLKKNAENLLQEAKDNSDRQADIMSFLSHEIRNPLSGITGLLDISINLVIKLEKKIALLPEDAAKPLQDIVDEIKDNLKKMVICADYQLRVLNTNLDLGKVTDKNFKLAEKVFDLKHSLAEVILILRVKAILKGIAINIITPEKTELWVKGDDLRLKQVIMNLIANAIKFTKKGSIEVTLMIQETTTGITRVQLDVKDSGIGLTPKELTRLFGRFIQAHDTTESQYGGSGLGLHLAKRITQAMHGDITVISESGVGSTFSAVVEFATLSKPERDEIEYKEEAKNSFPVIAVPTGAIGLFAVKPMVKRTVLVVDDNLINRKVLIKILVAAGHTCVEAIDGQKAVDIFLINKKISLILMDIQMPIKDGLEATIEIRALEATLNLPRIPIFAISGNAQAKDHKAARDAGMDKYFNKPYDKNELLAAIDLLPEVNILHDMELERSNTAPAEMKISSC